MSGHKHITESEARRIWHLHKKGLRPIDIAVVLERNVNSVHRLIDVFTMAESGKLGEAESKYGKTNKNLLAIAAAHFRTEVEVVRKTTEAPPAGDNTIKYLCEVLTELRRNNALLEKMVAAWEGK